MAQSGRSGLRRGLWGTDVIKEEMGKRGNILIGEGVRGLYRENDRSSIMLRWCEKPKGNDSFLNWKRKLPIRNTMQESLFFRSEGEGKLPRQTKAGLGTARHAL